MVGTLDLGYLQRSSSAPHLQEQSGRSLTTARNPGLLVESFSYLSLANWKAYKTSSSGRFLNQVVSRDLRDGETSVLLKLVLSTFPLSK